MHCGYWNFCCTGLDHSLNCASYVWWWYCSSTIICCVFSYIICLTASFRFNQEIPSSWNSSWYCQCKTQYQDGAGLLDTVVLLCIKLLPIFLPALFIKVHSVLRDHEGLFQQLRLLIAITARKKHMCQHFLNLHQLSQPPIAILSNDFSALILCCWYPCVLVLSSRVCMHALCFSQWRLPFVHAERDSRSEVMQKPFATEVQVLKGEVPILQYVHLYIHYSPNS